MRRAALVAGLLLLAPAAWARAPEELADLEATTDYAYYTGDAGVLARRLDAAAPLGDSDQILERYQYAHAVFRRLQLAVGAHDARLAQSLAGTCLRVLDAAAGTASERAEALVLKAACAGYEAMTGGVQALVQPLRIAGWLEDAARLAPDNPRVRLTRGIAAWYRRDAPAAAMAAAGRDFLAAANRFEELSVTAPGEPTWGAPEAWLFVGHARARAGDLVGARSAYERALLVAPAFVAAQRALDALRGGR